MEARFGTYFGSYPPSCPAKNYDQSAGFEGYHRNLFRA